MFLNRKPDSLRVFPSARSDKKSRIYNKYHIDNTHNWPSNYKRKGSKEMRKTVNMILVGLAGVLGNCAFLCEQARAQNPIVGDIEFFGSTTPSGSSLGPPVVVHFNNPWQTLAGTGIYAAAGIPFGTLATFNDFSFTGNGSTATLVGPDAPLWTFSFNNITYSFDLLNLTNGHTEPGSISFTANGIAHATGFDDTFATIGFQGAGNNFSFQISTSTTSSVPEAGVTALLGAGIALLAGHTLMQKRKAA